MLMDALVKAEPGKGLKLMKVEKPVPSFGEVLIKISKTAICGTDVHIYNWDPWSQQHIHPPMTIGHEYVGHIAELGQGVTGFHVGQRVSGEGHIVCGICRNCRAGNEQWCRHTKGVGVDRNGAFAEYVCIPATNVIPLKDTIPDELVAFFDAYGNAAHTALAFDVAGEDVLVTGAGPIGIMAAAICRHNGARRVVVTDINDYRLEMAKKLGATAIVNTKREDLTAVMKEQGIVEGFDVGLEMSGAAAARDQMIDSMRNGGKIALLGIGGSSEVDWNKIIWNGLTLKGIYGRTYDTWYKLTAMIEAGLDLTPLITHRFDYHDFDKGFEAMNSGNSGKVILDWEGK